MAKSKAKILSNARKFTQKGKWEKAIEEYEELLELEPDEPGTLNSIGDLYQKLNKLPTAIEYFNNSINQYFEIGLLNNAIAICKKILRADPNQVPVYKKLAELYQENGLTNDAIRHYVMYADKMHGKGNLDEVLDAFKNVVELSPSNTDIRLRLTELYIKQGHTSEAIDELFALVHHHEQAGDMEKAEEFRQRIAEIDPDALNQERAPRAAPAQKQKSTMKDPAFEMPEDLDDDDFESEDGLLEFKPSSTGELDGIGSSEEKLEEELPEELEEEPVLDDSDGLLDASELDLENIDLDAGALDEDEDMSLDMDDDLPPVQEITTSFSSDTEEEAPEEFDDSFGSEDDEFLEDSDSIDLEDEPVRDITADISSDMDEPVEDLTGSLMDEPEPESAPEPEPEPVPGPAVEKRPAEKSVDELRMHLSEHPYDNEARFELGNKLVESAPDDAYDEFVEAGDGFSSERHFSNAIVCYQKALDINPYNLMLHKKLLEAASNDGDIRAMIVAYINFADTLAHLGEKQKAQFVYQKVLNIDKDNEEAKQRLAKMEEEAARKPEAVEEEAPAAVPEEADYGPLPDDSGEGMVDLAELLKDEEEFNKPKSDRIRIERKDIDTSLELDDIINDFKAGVQEQYEEEDYESHYDLGLAYKEMGLIDESIAEFQIATRSSKQRLKAFEMLGQCFLEKNDLDLALKQFQRGIATPGHSEFEYLGLHYNIGLINERLEQWEEAKKAYDEVYVVDIGFRDVSDRLNAVQKNIKNPSNGN